MFDNLECLKIWCLSGPICAKLKEFYCTTVNAFYQQYYKALKCLVQAVLLAVMKKGCYFVSHVLTVSQYSVVTDRK